MLRKTLINVIEAEYVNLDSKVTSPVCLASLLLSPLCQKQWNSLWNERTDAKCSIRQRLPLNTHRHVEPITPWNSQISCGVGFFDYEEICPKFEICENKEKNVLFF